MRSQKRKNSSINKTELWKLFDEEIVNEDKVPIPLECVYGSGNREKCERCECLLAYSEEGFLVCSNTRCGIIYKDVMDQGAEWRFYGADDSHSSDPTRCGMPINPHLKESSFGCKVLAQPRMSYEMVKIRRYIDWQAMTHREKTLYDEFQTITVMAQQSGIPKLIIDDAITFHKKITETDVSFRKENRDGIIAASIYLSCLKHNFPRTPKEIATIFHLDASSSSKCCKKAMSIIHEIEKDLSKKEQTRFGKTKPEDFIERYCSKLNINHELTRLCMFIAMKIHQQGLMSENMPPSIAAGVIYLVVQLCQLNITKKDVKTVSESSEVTINKCYKKLEKIVIERNLIPSVIAQKYHLAIASQEGVPTLMC